MSNNVNMGSVEVTMRLRDALSAELAKIQRRLEQFADKSVSESARKAGEAIANAGKKATKDVEAELKKQLDAKNKAYERMLNSAHGYALAEEKRMKSDAERRSREEIRSQQQSQRRAEKAASDALKREDRVRREGAKIAADSIRHQERLQKQIDNRRARAIADAEKAYQRDHAAAIRYDNARTKGIEKEYQKRLAAEDRRVRESVRMLQDEARTALRLDNQRRASLERSSREWMRQRDSINRGGLALRSFMSDMARGSLAAVGLGGSIAGTIFTINQFAQAVIAADIALSQIQLRFKFAAEGSESGAQKMFQFAAEESRRLGLSLQATTDAYSRFASAARGTRLEGELGRKVFTGVSEAAAALGLNAYQTERAFKALEQMVSKGTVQMEELRGQLSEQIPGSFQTLARAMGVTTQKLSEMMEKGLVPGVDAVQKLAEEWHKMFGPTAALNAERLTGAVASLESEWFRFKTAVADDTTTTDFFRGLAIIVGKIADAMERSSKAAGEFIDEIEKRNNLKLTASERRRIKTATERTNLDADPESFAADLFAKSLSGVEADAVARHAAEVKALTILYEGLAEKMKLSVEEAKNFVQYKFVNGRLVTTTVDPSTASQGRGGILEARRAQIAAREKAAEEAKKQAEKDRKEAEKEAERLRERMAEKVKEYSAGLDDTILYERMYAEALEATNGNVATATSYARRFMEVRELGNAVTEEERQALIAKGMAIDAEDAKKEEAARREEARLNRVEQANAKVIAAQELRVQQTKDAADARREVMDSTEAEAEYAEEYAEAALKGAAGLREFAIQSEIFTRQQAIMHDQALNPAPLEVYNARLEEIATNVRRAFDAQDLADYRIELNGIIEEMNRSLQEGLIDLGIGVFKDLINGAKVTWEEIGKSLLNMFVDVFAQVLKDWLILQAKMAATDYARKSGATGYAADGMGPPTSAMAGAGGSAAAGSGMSAASVTALWAFAAVAIFAVAARWYQKEQRKKVYGTAADVGMYEGGAGSMWAVGGGGNAKLGGEVAVAIRGLLQELEGVANTFITSIDRTIVSIRNDKKRFRVEVGGVVKGTFKTMEEAIVAAARHSFMSSNAFDDLAPAIREMVQNFTGKTVDEFKEGLAYIRDIVNETTGLSDVEIHLRELPMLIRQVAQNLTNLGVSAGEAMRLATQWGVIQFQNAWDQISGKQRTPQEELAIRKAQATLLLAQVKLWKLELQARKAFLEGELKLMQAEWGGGGGGGGGGIIGGMRGTALRMGSAAVAIEAAIYQQELALQEKFLRGRAEGVRGQAAIYQAELDVINEALKALDVLIASIDLGSIHIPDLGAGLGDLSNAMNDLKDALMDLAKFQRDMLTNELSPFTTEQQSKILGEELFSLLGKDNLKADDVRRIMELVPQYLEAFGDAFGTAGSGYFSEFSKIQEMIAALLESNGIEPLVDWQQQLEDLFGVSMFPGNGGVASVMQVSYPALEEEAGRTTEAVHLTRRSIQDGANATVDAIRQVASEVRALRVGALNNSPGGVRTTNQIPGQAA